MKRLQQYIYICSYVVVLVDARLYTSMRNEPNKNSERETVNHALGKRSGYEKGLRYGVVPSKCTKRLTCESSKVEALREKLNGTEEDLRDVAIQIESQQEMIGSQETLNKNYDDRCKKQDEEIKGLKEGQYELKQMLVSFMQQNPDKSCKLYIFFVV